MDKDLKRILKAAQAQGFEIRTTTNGHPMVYDQDGQFVTQTATTPGDWRGQRNLIAALRRRGFQWPPKR